MTRHYTPAPRPVEHMAGIAAFSSVSRMSVFSSVVHGFGDVSRKFDRDSADVCALGESEARNIDLLRWMPWRGRVSALVMMLVLIAVGGCLS